MSRTKTSKLARIAADIATDEETARRLHEEDIKAYTEGLEAILADVLPAAKKQTIYLIVGRQRQAIAIFGDGMMALSRHGATLVAREVATSSLRPSLRTLEVAVTKALLERQKATADRVTHARDALQRTQAIAARICSRAKAKSQEGT